MLVAEITKGAPLPGTPAAIMLEELQAEKDEQAAQEAAAAAEEAGGLEEELPEEEALAEDEPLPEGIAPEDEGIVEEAPVEDIPIKFMGRDGKPMDAWTPSEVFTASVEAKADYDAAGAESATEAEDLKRWQRKALKWYKAGKAMRLLPFESGAIAYDTFTRVRDDLMEADSPDAIKAAFKRDAVDTLLDDVDADARAWAGEASE
jgi:hypothetical protein